MLNSGLKKEAVNQLKQATEDYNNAIQKLTEKSLQLHARREKIASLMERVERYINLLANTPKSFDRTVEMVKIERKKFTKLMEIEYDEKTAHKVAGGGTAVGVAAGTATAAFAPTAAIALATTFGTASTGTAIASLSGAAATNAALAWLGGGALAAGGSGIAGGNALLALAGPIGWAIGAGSLVGGGIYANKKNKEAAIKANQEYIEVNKEKKVVQALTLEIYKLKMLSYRNYKSLNKQFSNFIQMAQGKLSYTDFTPELKLEIGDIVNKTEIAAQLLSEKVGD